MEGARALARIPGLIYKMFSVVGVKSDWNLPAEMHASRKWALNLRKSAAAELIQSDFDCVVWCRCQAHLREVEFGMALYTCARPALRPGWVT